MTYGVPTHGESANRFPGEDARLRPGRSRPHSPGARASRSAPFLSPARFSLRTRLSRGDVLPRSTLWLGLKGPAVSVGFQTQACDSLDSPKPPAACGPEMLAVPAGPRGGGPSRQGVCIA